MRKLQLSLSAAILVLLATPGFAQRNTGSIRGTVTDSTGAIVPGAKVTLKSEATGLARAATTNAAGSYSFADLPVGTYDVEVEPQRLQVRRARATWSLNVAESRAVDVAARHRRASPRRSPCRRRRWPSRPSAATSPAWSPASRRASCP